MNASTQAAGSVARELHRMNQMLQAMQRTLAPRPGRRDACEKQQAQDTAKQEGTTR